MLILPSSSRLSLIRDLCLSFSRGLGFIPEALADKSGHFFLAEDLKRLLSIQFANLHKQYPRVVRAGQRIILKYGLDGDSTSNNTKVGAYVVPMLQDGAFKAQSRDNQIAIAVHGGGEDGVRKDPRALAACQLLARGFDLSIGLADVTSTNGTVHLSTASVMDLKCQISNRQIVDSPYSFPCLVPSFFRTLSLLPDPFYLFFTNHTCELRSVNITSRREAARKLIALHAALLLKDDEKERSEPRPVAAPTSIALPPSQLASRAAATFEGMDWSATTENPTSHPQSVPGTSKSAQGDNVGESASEGVGPATELLDDDLPPLAERAQEDEEVAEALDSEGAQLLVHY